MQHTPAEIPAEHLHLPSASTKELPPNAASHLQITHLTATHPVNRQNVLSLHV